MRRASRVLSQGDSDGGPRRLSVRVGGRVRLGALWGSHVLESFEFAV